MAEKITELTEAQKAQMPVYRDEYIGIAKDTSPADWEEASKIVVEMLRIAKIDLDPGFRVIRCDNPVLAAQAGNELSKADGGGKNLFQASSSVGSAARNNFFVEVCGVQLTPELEHARKTLTEFVKVCGGAYFHNKFTIIYDRPSVLKLRDNNGTGVLHCEDGPALAWGRDAGGNYDPEAKYGYKLYFWEGTRVPEAWIMDKPTTPEAMKLRAQEVLTSENTEVLRSGCEILGWLPVLESLGMKVLDENPDPKFGRLVSVDLPNAPDSRFLVATCGTGRLVAVPAFSEAKTALEAGAMSYGVDIEVYTQLKTRT
jgi:hypothetical protein